MSATLNVRSIRRELEQQRTVLIQRIEKEELLLAAPMGTNSDPADQAQQYASNQCRAAVLARLRAQLEQIEAALRRVADGVYGICAECGKGIAPARLQALPYALLCVSCQTRQEKTA